MAMKHPPKPVSVYHVPKDFNAVSTIAGMVLKFTLTIRKMKHQDCMSIAKICDAYPSVSQEWIEKIAFYKVLGKLDIPQRRVSVIIDTYEIGAEAMLELSQQLGLKLTPTEQKNIVELEERYKSWWRQDDDDSVD